MNEQLWIKRQVGNRIREARGAQSQGELGQKIGVTDVMISKYERGATLPPPDKLELLANVTGKPLAWFYDLEEAFVDGSKGAGSPELFELLRLEHHRHATVWDAFWAVIRGEDGVALSFEDEPIREKLNAGNYQNLANEDFFFCHSLVSSYPDIPGYALAMHIRQIREIRSMGRRRRNG